MLTDFHGVGEWGFADLVEVDGRQVLFDTGPTRLACRLPRGVVEDSIPEDASLVIDTPRGLVVITGCGHAGIINTIEYARSAVRKAPAYAVIGGLHIFRASATLRPR